MFIGNCTAFFLYSYSFTRISNYIYITIHSFSLFFFYLFYPVLIPLFLSFIQFQYFLRFNFVNSFYFLYMQLSQYVLDCRFIIREFVHCVTAPLNDILIHIVLHILQIVHIHSILISFHLCFDILFVILINSFGCNSSFFLPFFLLLFCETGVE